MPSTKTILFSLLFSITVVAPQATGAGSNFQAITTPFLSQPGAISYLYVADVNKDGKPDVITTDVGGQAAYVLLGKGDGTFQPPIMIPLGILPFPVIVADVTGDGIPDLVVAGVNDQLQPVLEILRGAGDGTFQPLRFQPLNAFGTAIVPLDYNKDGKVDIAVEESAGLLQSTNSLLGEGLAGIFSALSLPQLELLSGDGQANFTSTQVIPFQGGAGLRLALADYNADGYPDVALNEIITGNILVFLNKRDGTFAAPVTYPTITGVAQSGAEFLTADVNSDGKPDLVMSTGQNNKVAILIGKGDGTFQAPQYITLNDAGGLAVADFNRDGVPDLAIGTTASFNQISADSQTLPPAGADSIYILNGTAGSPFSGTPNRVNSGSIPIILETADFNGDGLPDLVAGNLVLGSVTVYLNQPGPAAPAIISAAANVPNLAADSLAAAYGTNLAASTLVSPLPLMTNLGGVSVSVLDSAGVTRQAPLIFVSAGQIDFIVPAGTATGKAFITISGSPAPSAPATVTITNVAPAIFTANSSGKGVPAALAVRVNNSTNAQTPVAVFNCPAAGQCVTAPIALDSGSTVYLSLYGTGIRGAKSVTATVNGNPVTVQFAGAQGQFAGLDQVNLILTSALTVHGDVPVVLTVDGVQTNTVTINLP